MWRDQFVFIGDDGTVIPVGVMRWSPGDAEAKGWLGDEGGWRSNFFQRFPISRPAGPDVERAVRHLSRSKRSPARITLTREEGGVELGLRTRSERFLLGATSLSELGRSTDPEGTSVYRAGRATWTGRGRTQEGWLVVEETPENEPRKPFIEYGDFIFLVIAHPESGPVIAKRSLGRSGFDHAFATVSGRSRKTARVDLDRNGSGLALSLPELGLGTQLSILDRQVTAGTAPDQSGVAYEALLMGGDYRGVAFTIRSAAKETSP